MSGFKKEFWESLRADFDCVFKNTDEMYQNPEVLPFICRYIKEKDDKLVDSNKQGDIYLQILRIEAENSPKDLFLYMLNKIVGKNLGKNENIRFYAQLIYLNRKNISSSERIYRRAELNRMNYADALKLIHDEIRNDKESAADEVFYGRYMERFTAYVKKEALKRAALIRMYDAEKERTADESMNLVDAYFDTYGSYSLYDSCSDLRTERLNKAEILYGFMKNDPSQTGAFIPVSFERGLGCGLFIIGADVIRRYFGKSNSGYPGEFHKRIKRSDVYAYLCLTAISYEELILVYNNIYTDFDEAYESYKKEVRTNSSVYELSNTTVPDYCPDEFRKFFSHDIKPSDNKDLNLNKSK